MNRGRLLVALALVTPLGFATKLTDLELVSGYLGGVFYVVFWVLAVLLVWPGLDPRKVAAAVFAATCGIELLQLWHPRFLETARSTLAGQTLLGSTFSWWDLPAYAVGAGIGTGVAALCRA